MKNKFSRHTELGLVVFLALVFISGLFWVNLQYSKNNPGGNDFLVHYVGTRSLIFDDLSPYSDQVALRIQTAAYGHPAQGVEHELRVAYPLYSVFLFAPFSMISDYDVARAAWMTVLEMALVALALLTLSLLDWRPSLMVQALILLFSLIWYHAFRGVINGNAVILVALLITMVFSYLKSGQDELAGFLLALTTIKPHLVIVIIGYIIFWAVYQKRWKLLAWFFGTLAALVSLAWLIIPNWIYQNIWEVLRYPAYNPAGTLAAALTEWFPAYGVLFNYGIALILGLLLLRESWNSRNGKYCHFLWTGLLIMVFSQWIGIQTDPGNFVILFPGLILILANIVKKWERQGTLISIIYLFVLFVLPWAVFVLTLQRGYQPIQNSVMFIPVPLFSILGLYWIKWWMISSSSTNLDNNL